MQTRRIANMRKARRIGKCLIVVIALVSTGCGDEITASAGDSSPVHAVGEAGDPDLSCVDGIVRNPEFCRVTDGGEQAYRYGIVPAGRKWPGSGQAIVVDPGGPGLSALAGGGVARLAQEYLGSLASEYDVVVIEEPWVTAEWPDGCAGAMSDFYLGICEEPWELRTAAVAANCLAGSPQWGLSPETYGALLDEIETAHDTQIVGFAGSSFAAARWAYADPRRFDFAVLVRPFPLGVFADTPLGARGELIEAAADRIGEPVFGFDVSPDPPEGRSLTVGASDQAVAQIAAAASGLVPAGQAKVGRLADGFWQRFGETSISLALLAYWQEVCGVIGAPRANPWSGEPRDTTGYLVSFHQICDRIPAVDLDLPDTAPRLCVVLSVLDTVSPSSLAEAVFAPLGAEVVYSDDSQHASLDGLDLCFQKIGLGVDATTAVDQARNRNWITETGDRLPTAKTEPSTLGSLGSLAEASGEVRIDGAVLGWELIEETGCQSGGSSPHWVAEIGPESLSVADVLLLGHAEATSWLVVAHEELGEQWVEEQYLGRYSASGPNSEVGIEIEVQPDGDLFMAVGVPEAAVGQRMAGDTSKLRELESPCWSQRWDRRTAEEELSDIWVNYGAGGAAAVLRARAQRFDMAPVVDARFPNMFRYTDEGQETSVVVIDLRPTTIVSIGGYQYHRMPSPEEIAELIGLG